MVEVFLRGGLGNQMFQYAAGLGLARENNTDLILDTVPLRDRFPRPHFTPRTFDLADVFAIEPRLTGLSVAADRVPVPGMWLGLDLFRMSAASALGRATVVYEDERKALDPAFAAARGARIVIYGRWENERYFIAHEKEVRAAFRFRHALDGEAAALAARIAGTNSVSVHVRRGDRVTDVKIQRQTGATDLSYYNEAMAYAAAHVASPEFFIFSDDIEWCKEHLKVPQTATYVPASAAGPKGAHHLHLMSLCKSHIITNSTFSWWGAWLDPNPQKLVIAPARWAETALADKKGIVPEAWVRLPKGA